MIIRNRDQLLDIVAPSPVLARRREALDLMEAALQSVDAKRGTRRAIERLQDRHGPLPACTVFAFGKASIPMAEAALECLDVKQGVVLCLEDAHLSPLRVIRAGHPLPAPDAFERGAEVLQLAESLESSDCALCLVSGGGSAMLEAPQPGISLAEIQRATRSALQGGADIATLNEMRQRLSRIKAGGLARALAPATVYNVVLSDVPGHPPALVASGPTFSSEVPDTHCEVAAENAVAREAIVRAAQATGRDIQVARALLVGEARQAGARFQWSAQGRSLVAGGETTVTVRGDGLGGRNQEFVLGALSAWQGGLTVAFGTDGVDGCSLDAGALVDDYVLQEMQRRGINPGAFLEQNDSNGFFRELGAAIHTGPTGTNVADLAIHLAPS